MPTVLIDYTPFYYTSILHNPVPPIISGKFVQIRNAQTIYLVVSPQELTRYHANIIERFCMDKGIEGNYDAKREKFTISDHEWQIIGGGKFERDDNKKAVKLYDNSMAYGKFDATGLKEMLMTLPEYSSYNVIIE